MRLWRKFRDRFLGAPVKWKVTFIILVACAVVLNMAFASYLIIEIVSHRQETEEALGKQAAIIGKAGEAALIEQDKAALQAKLESLRTHGDIARVFVVTKDDRIFASMINDTDETDFDPQRLLHGGLNSIWTMWYFEDIKHDGEAIGRVYIESHLEDLREDMLGAVKVFILLFIILLPIAVRLSLWLQDIIFNPLLKPVGAAGLEKKRMDGAAILSDSSEVMLAQIEDRGTELEKFRRELEDEIAQGSWKGEKRPDSEARFQSMALTTPIPVLISRASDGAVLYANRYLGRVIGLSMDQLYSLETLDLYYDPKDRARLLDKLKKEGFVQNEELRVKKSDGSMVWVSVSMRPLIFDDVPSVMVTLLDITEQKNNIALLQNFSEKLVAAIDKERKRVASELHDGLGQNLLVIKIGLKKYLKSLSGNQSKSEPLDKLVSITQHLIDDIRIIAWNLHPHQLDKLGLIGAIESTIRKNAEFSEIKFTSQIGNIDSLLPKEKEIHLYRIIQELISNIIKHSGAKEVDISIEDGGGSLNVTITDDGTGFSLSSEDTTQAGGVGLGLTGILERMKILDGSFDIAPTASGGSAVTIKIPVR